jgi:3'(2'), 5'-bisphosphate nucleotidase
MPRDSPAPGFCDESVFAIPHVAPATIAAPMEDSPLNADLPDLDAVARIAREAGEVVMRIYRGDFAVRRKADASPVTEADEAAERLIVPALRALAPGVPVVAEDMASRGQADAIRRRFWLVDRLDGTREFVNRNGEFTVNIALIVEGRAVLGVVDAPAQGPRGRLYAGCIGADGPRAWIDDEHGRRALRVRAAPAEGLTVVASRSHGDEAALDRLLAGRRVARRVNAGSSLKLCLLAAGEADLYPRQGRTMEWDIAAGHAVLAAAGGSVRTLAGEDLRYGKPGFENPHFVAAGIA